MITKLLDFMAQKGNVTELILLRKMNIKTVPVAWPVKQAARKERASAISRMICS